MDALARVKTALRRVFLADQNFNFWGLLKTPLDTRLKSKLSIDLRCFPSIMKLVPRLETPVSQLFNKMSAEVLIYKFSQKY